jgi:hypothetical protein
VKPPADFLVETPAAAALADDPLSLEDVAERIADRVLRPALSRPGFAVLDFGPNLEARPFRALLLALAAGLDRRSRRSFGRQLQLVSVGRFDQQATTEAHRDGAPEESLLLLGYEPTEVDSRLYLLDDTHAAADHGLTPAEFAARFNPMLRRGTDLLAPYSAAVEPFDRSHYRVAVVNNSSCGPEGGRRGMLGVLHRAVVETPRPDRRRNVNSLVLAGADPEAAPRLDAAALRAFLEQARHSAG